MLWATWPIAHHVFLQTSIWYKNKWVIATRLSQNSEATEGFYKSPGARLNSHVNGWAIGKFGGPFPEEELLEVVGKALMVATLSVVHMGHVTGSGRGGSRSPNGQIWTFGKPWCHNRQMLVCFLREDYFKKRKTRIIFDTTQWCFQNKFGRVTQGSFG